MRTRKPRVRWVVSIERRQGTALTRCVLTVMSRRHTADSIVKHFEALGRMLFLRIDEQVEETAFNNKHRRFESSQAGGCDVVYNAHHFILHGQLSEVFAVDEPNGAPRMHWRPLAYRVIPSGRLHQPPECQAEIARLSIADALPLRAQ